MEGTSSGSHDRRPPTKTPALEFDLNEAPPEPPESDWRMICESCGVLGSGEEMMVCCVCGGGFHLTCLGTEERRVEWTCFKCLMKVPSEKKPSTSAAAAAPQEVNEEGEGFVTGLGTGIGIGTGTVTPFTSATFNVPLQSTLNFVKEKVMGCYPLAYGSRVSENFLDDFPVQFEDFFVMTIGKIDPRPSFYNACEIWPVGYRSIWHDRITGSVFVCQVLDHGISRPVFRVRRLPCAKHSIPNASRVIWKPKVGLNDGTDKVPSDDSPFSGLVGDDDMNIQTILAECSPPRLDTNILSCTGISADPNQDFQKVRCLATGSSLLSSPPGVIPDNFGSGDIIGEFLVDASSSASAWEMVSETLIGACRKVYDETGSFRFGCKHSLDGGDLYSPESFGSLSKFCYSANPIINIPGFIVSTKELDASCEVLSKWIRLDRFGLDMGFVQELIEQLPGAILCSNYQSLGKRIQSSSLQTVGNGLLLARRKNDLKVEKESCSLIQSCRRPNLSGKQFSSKLPQKLIGDVLQACDFSWRFSEVLELGAPFSLPEIEDELINPWLDAENPLNKSAIEIEHIGNKSSCNSSGANDLTSGPSSASYRNFHGRDFCEVITTEINSVTNPSQADPASNTHIRCTGVLLENSNTSLLKVVISELLSKVKPNLDSGESNMRQGKKNDVENLVSGKTTKLDLLPINELTWPELARRYILAAVSMDGIDSDEIIRQDGKLPAEITREFGKIFHCLQGDGGYLCGSLIGVAAIEADAVLLAEASNKIFGSIQNKFDVLRFVRKEPDSSSLKEVNVRDRVIPEWALELEPVRKLRTNIGARIRACINKALEKNPPVWAQTILKQSISKEVYRGNSCAPTKKMALSVLSGVTPEDLKPEKKKKSRKVKSLSEIIMKQCRIMLRHAIAADEKSVFCNLLAGRTLGNDEKEVLGYPAIVSRPLDFRTIDIRLTAGAYSGSHEAFIEDIREVWQSIRTAYGERPEFADLVERLSQKFEKLYEEEVLSLVNRVSERAEPNHKSEDRKEEVDGILTFTSERSLPKAPWDNGVCKLCGIDKDDEYVLLCDNCDSEYHTYCLDPPLLIIPDGNWYCPLCDPTPSISQDRLCGTHLIRRQGRKRRIQREFTQKVSETVTHLADVMEVKEYWELTLEERVFLLKYLCDEALSSSIIHDHLDHCASIGDDMQSKLQSSTSELKHLKSGEDILVANLAKSKENICSGELGLETSASMKSDDDKLLGRTEREKTAIRRELLGWDASGRLYWAFGDPGTFQKVIVGGSWKVQEGKETELVDSIEENLVSYSCFLSSGQNYFDANELSSWTCYESDAEICELLGCLRDCNAREMELKESIAQLQRNNLKYSKNAPNHLQNKVKLSSCNHFPLTKAKTVLEKMFGACLEVGPIEILKSQDSGDKITSESRLYRCGCLELIRPSKHHCLLCHRTFCTAEELEGHKNGNCKLVSFVPKSCQENEGSSKGKRKILEGPPRQKSLYSRKKSKKESGGGIQPPTDNPNVTDFLFNFEDIKSKFVTKDSLKEEVSEIGLIGAGGTPTFMPQMSASNIDPAEKNKANSCGVTTVTENLQQLLPKGEYNPMNEPSKAERFKSKGITGNSQRNKRSLLGVDKSRIIGQSSLRPLVGKITEILKQLKINLLDMDVALPDEAFRPSRTTSEKRFLWREFVKAAESIYEMIQAIIVLEDMIKTEYLRNNWWYWSSPAAAAKVSTVSALALRIYALDDAIIYDKTLPSVNKAETNKKEESFQKPKPENNPRACSPPLGVTFSLGSSSKSKKGKKSKKKTDSGDEFRI